MRTESFGQLLKKLRIEKANIGLRRFAELVEMYPSNLSNIERGKAPPPAKSEKIELICEALGLSKSDPLRSKLFDLAAQYKPNRMPADVANIIKNNAGVPVLVRTVDNKQLSENKLKELAKYIEEHY
jgi:transcriptional regulator with XRE-family HTH domain